MGGNRRIFKECEDVVFQLSEIVGKGLISKFRSQVTVDINVEVAPYIISNLSSVSSVNENFLQPFPFRRYILV